MLISCLSLTFSSFLFEASFKSDGNHFHLEQNATTWYFSFFFSCLDFISRKRKTQKISIDSNQTFFLPNKRFSVLRCRFFSRNSSILSFFFVFLFETSKPSENSETLLKFRKRLLNGALTFSNFGLLNFSFVSICFSSSDESKVSFFGWFSTVGLLKINKSNRTNECRIANLFSKSKSSQYRNVVRETLFRIKENHIFERIISKSMRDNVVDSFGTNYYHHHWHG